MVSIAGTVMGVVQALRQRVPVICGNKLILGIYSGYVILLILVLSATAGCGRLPNPFDPTTWLPCCCPGAPSPCP